MFDGFELAMIELPDARLRVRWVGQGRHAGIFIDHLHDADDRTAGRKLAMPTFILWSMQVDLEDSYGRYPGELAGLDHRPARPRHRRRPSHGRGGPRSAGPGADRVL